MADLANLKIKVDSRDLNRAKTDLSALGTQAGKTETQVGGAMRKMSSSAQQLTSMLKQVAAALGAIATVQTFIRLSDEATKYTAQLKLATTTTQEFARANADVQRIARGAQADIASIGVLYARTANALRQLGANQTQVAAVTESVALALKVSGASAAESASAILQLSQAFASGVLRGEEFNSVNEAAPRLMKLLADSLGVPIGQLRAMAADGKLTADIVANALIPAVEQLRKEAAQTNTIAGVFVVLKNEVLAFVAELNKISAVGASLQKSVPLWTGALIAGMKGLAIAGLAVKSIFEAVGTTLGGIAAAVMFLVNGEFQNAATTIRNLKDDVSGIGSSFMDASRAILDYTPVVGDATTTTDLLAQSTGGVSKEAEKAAKAYAKVRETIAEQITGLMQYITLVQQGMSADEANLRVQLMRQGALESEIETIVDLTAEQKALDEAIKTQRQSYEEAERAAKAYRESLFKIATDLDEQIRNAQLEADAVGMTAVQRQLLVERLAEEELVRLEATAAQLAQNDATLIESELIREQIAKRRELLALQRQRLEGAERLERATEEIRKQQNEAKELDRIFGDIGRSLTDSLFRGFESGKGFARNLKDTVVNLFKTTIIRIPLQGVLTGITSAVAGALGFSGVANASGVEAAGSFGGGFLNALSTGKTVFDAFSGSLTGSLSSFATTLGNAGFSSGASFVNGFSSALNGGSAASFSGASSAFNLGNFAGQAAPFLPAVFSLLQGDIKGAAFSGGGAAIGTALGGPVGGIVGGALGSLLGGLFGGSGPKAIRTEANTTLGGGTTLGAPGKAGIIDGVVDGIGQINKQFLETLNGLLTAVGAADAANAELSSAIGLFDKRRRGGFEFTLKANGQDISTGRNDTFGNDVKVIAEALQKELLGPALRDAFVALAGDVVTPAIKSFLEATDEAADVQARLQSVTALINAQDKLREKFGITADQVVAIANKTGDLNGLLAGLSARIDQQFVTQKLIDDGFADLNGRLTDLGLTTLPTTVAEFDAALRAIDKTSEAGRDLFAAMLQLGPAFNELVAASEALKRVTEALALTGQTSLRVTDALLSGAGGFEGLAAGIDAFVNGVLSPQQRFEVQLKQTAASFNALGLQMPTTAEGFRTLVAGIDTTTESGQRLYGQIIALAPAFVGLQSALAEFDSSIFALTGQTSLRVTDALLSGAGGFEGLAAGIDAFVNGVLSSGDRLKLQAQDIAEQFARLGLVAPASIEGFRDLVAGIDTTTESGQRLYGQIIALTPAFVGLQSALAEFDSSILAVYDQILQARDAARDTVLSLFEQQQQATQDARDALQELVREQADAARQSASAFDRIIASLRDFGIELTSIAAADGPFALAVSRAQFDTVARNARLGNLDALEALPGAGRDFLQVAANNSSTREDFLRELALVRQATEDAEGVAVRQKSIAEQQLEALQAQTMGLLDIEANTLTIEQAIKNLQDAQAAEDSTRQQLTALGLLAVQGISIEDAIRNLESAEAAAAQATEQLTALGLIKGSVDTVASLMEQLAALLAQRANIVAQPAIQSAAAAQIEAVRASGMVANGLAATIVTDREQQIAALYREALGRVPDIGGLQSFLSSSLTIAQVEDVIRNSEEARVRNTLGVASQNDFNRIVNEQLGVSTDIQAFARGGTFGGGLRLVGERGPELEVTGPSRIFNAQQTARMLSSGDSTGMENRMERLEAAMYAVAKNTGKTYEQLRRWDDGDRMNVRVDQDGEPPIRVAS